MTDIHSFEPIWDGWVIDEMIGKGSFSTVWSAHRDDPLTNTRQTAAVKHISIPSNNAVEEDLDRNYSVQTRRKLYKAELDSILKEIRVQASLRGMPNIVNYQDHKIVARPDGLGYDIFTLIELLTTLPDYLKQHGALDCQTVICLGVDIANALEAMESKKMIHRDIKPANIFVDDEGNFKLSNFNLSRVLEGNQYFSTFTGTPNYMAPEFYLRRGAYDQTVDIYSLGITLYQYMNKGFLPFMSETQTDFGDAIHRRSLGETLPPPVNADPAFAQIILKCCAHSPKNRYQNAAQLKKDLLALPFLDIQISNAEPLKAKSPEPIFGSIHDFEPIWDGWVVDEELGHGSFGTVWSAHHDGDQYTNLRKTAAIKHISIPADKSAAEEYTTYTKQTKQKIYRAKLDELIAEIKSQASLSGMSNIVDYQDHRIVDKPDGLGYDLFLRMELLTGLPAYFKKHGNPDRDTVIRLGIDIANAIEIMEGKKMIHRDIKPANTFVDSAGTFKLGDFGTARVLESTLKGSTYTGTPFYMAPEVYNKKRKYGQTVDIYSLGIMLYRYMNNGYVPFMSATQTNEVEALTKRAKGVPFHAPVNADPEFARIIMKCCAYHWWNRYQNAAQLKRDLQALQLQSPAPKGKTPQVKDPDKTVLSDTVDTEKTKTAHLVAPQKKKLLPIIIAAIITVAAGIGIQYWLNPPVPPTPTPTIFPTLTATPTVSPTPTLRPTPTATHASGYYGYFMATTSPTPTHAGGYYGYFMATTSPTPTPTPTPTSTPALTPSPTPTPTTTPLGLYSTQEYQPW